MSLIGLFGAAPRDPRVSRSSASALAERRTATSAPKPNPAAKENSRRLKLAFHGCHLTRFVGSALLAARRPSWPAHRNPTPNAAPKRGGSPEGLTPHLASKPAVPSPSGIPLQELVAFRFLELAALRVPVQLDSLVPDGDVAQHGDHADVARRIRNCRMSACPPSRSPPIPCSARRRFAESSWPAACNPCPTRRATTSPTAARSACWHRFRRTEWRPCSQS